MPLIARRADILFKFEQMFLHQRLERRVDRRRGSPAIFADDRREPVRQCIGNAGQNLFDQRTDRQFMLGIDEGPQKADANRLEIAFLQLQKQGPHSVFIQRKDHIALCVYSFGNLESPPPRNVGRGIGFGEIIAVQLPPLLEHENIGETFGGEERRLRDVARNDGVRSARCAVDEQRRIRQQLLKSQTKIGCGSLDGLAEAAEHTAMRG